MTLNAKYDNYFKRTLNSENASNFPKWQEMKKLKKGDFQRKITKCVPFGAQK